MPRPRDVRTEDPAPGRQLRARARASVGALLAQVRLPADRRVPPPRAFAGFGPGSWIVPPTRVHGAEAIEVGVGVIVLEGSDLLVDAAGGARLILGDRTRLAPGVQIRCSVGITIGEAVSSSDCVTITDSWTPFQPPRARDGSKAWDPRNRREVAPPAPAGAPVVIEDGAYLGWGSVIGPGVRIGTGAIVGEGAVVVDDVAPHAVVYGNPARLAPGYGDAPRPPHAGQPA